MARHNKNRKRTRRARHTSRLADHRREKKILTPPFLQLRNVETTSWRHDALPDFLWLLSLVHETADLTRAHTVLDLLDTFMPPDPPPLPAPPWDGAAPTAADTTESRPINSHLDGLLSSFALLPEERRRDARNSVFERLPWAFSDRLGHALALYPDCPASWLYADWSTSNHADPEIGLAYLKHLVTTIFDPGGRASSQLRLLPIARLLKHGRMHFAADLPTIDLLPQYPNGLTHDEQLQVEQWARATWNAVASLGDRDVGRGWAMYFWRQNWRISACERTPGNAGEDLADEDDDYSLPTDSGQPPPATTVYEARNGFLTAIDALGADLRDVQRRLDIDLYQPTADEVKLGLASRMFRLLRHLVASPRLWTNELGPHVLRSMVDARIIIAWLLKQDDTQMYEQFKAYGLGKRKLFKLQLEELMDRDDLVDEDNEALHDRLHAEVNLDSMEELVTIDVGGSFSKRNIREMAKETGLAELYSLQYQPLSAEAHGEWSSLTGFDLQHCTNPLHRYHRIGVFGEDTQMFAHVGWVRNAFGLAEDAITDIFASYDVDAEEAFEKCRGRMVQAQAEPSKSD